MRVLVSGSSGLVGSALLPTLAAAGHSVLRLVRPSSRDRGAGVVWDPAQGVLPASELQGIDAVVHLAGEGIAERRWSAEQKARIRDSRVQGTRLLAETIAGLERKPGVFVSASGIGYYGDRGADVVTETSPPGTGFLADVCREWEAATSPAAAAGVRVVNLRIGIVLSAAGGALAKMLLPFRLGLGGKIGSGRQYMSWIALDDLVGTVNHALAADGLRGPINGVAPSPVSNAEFTRTLGRVLRRPTIFPLPAFVARLMMGEMADELLLSSTRVEPVRLQQSGYRFQFSELEAALRHVLLYREPGERGALAP